MLSGGIPEVQRDERMSGKGGVRHLLWKRWNCVVPAKKVTL